MVLYESFRLQGLHHHLIGCFVQQKSNVCRLWRPVCLRNRRVMIESVTQSALLSLFSSSSTVDPVVVLLRLVVEPAWPRVNLTC